MGLSGQQDLWGNETEGRALYQCRGMYGCLKWLPLEKFYTTDGKLARNICKECDKARVSAARIKAGNEGHCYSCMKNIPFEGNSKCEVCYLKDKARDAGLRTEDWEAIKAMFGEQKGLCPLTGLPITLGNAELDHIKPKIDFPELANDLSNLQWVLPAANRGKWMGSVEEFWIMCLGGAMVYLKNATKGVI